MRQRMKETKRKIPEQIRIQRLRAKKSFATFTCRVIHTKRTKHLLDNLSVEEP